MADQTSAPPKPSSSVKLVLLGEAAVGKVWVSRPNPSHSFPCCGGGGGGGFPNVGCFWIGLFADVWGVFGDTGVVVVGITICQQRFSGEQGADYWRYVVISCDLYPEGAI